MRGWSPPRGSAAAMGGRSGPSQSPPTAAPPCATSYALRRIKARPGQARAKCFASHPGGARNMSDEPNMPVSTASVSWVDSGGQVHLRVYSCDGYTVTEMANDGNGWQETSYTQGSDASATAWQDSQGNAHVRLYCTSDDGTTEWCYDEPNGWSQGSYQPPSANSTARQIGAAK